MDKPTIEFDEQIYEIQAAILKILNDRNASMNVGISAIMGALVGAVVSHGVPRKEFLDFAAHAYDSLKPMMVRQ